jgi:hypothetical protein
MRKIYYILIIVTVLCTEMQSQCVVDEIEHIDILSTSHCTSTMLSKTKVVLNTVRKNMHVGKFEWYVFDSTSNQWQNLQMDWVVSANGDSIVNSAIDSTTNHLDYLCIFVENITGCRDSSSRRIILDNSPHISVFEQSLEGKNLCVVKNLRNQSGLGDEFTWFNRLGMILSTNDTILAEEYPCTVRVIDCTGCVDEKNIMKYCRQGAILIFPNPADSYITISIVGQCEVNLFDLIGKMILEMTVYESDFFHINTSLCAEGTYILRVCDEPYVVSVRH